MGYVKKMSHFSPEAQVSVQPLSVIHKTYYIFSFLAQSGSWEIYCKFPPNPKASQSKRPTIGSFVCIEIQHNVF